MKIFDDPQKEEYYLSKSKRDSGLIAGICFFGLFTIGVLACLIKLFRMT